MKLPHKWNWPKLGEVTEFRLTLNAETDRGVALVCAAYIDVELESLLRQTLIDDPTIVDKLFEYPGVIGSFSSKIELAFALGLIDKDTYKSLRKIKRIRNDFAHCHQERRFCDQDIADQCKNLMQTSTSVPDDNPRKLFIGSCMTILAALYIHIRLAKHAEIAAPIKVQTFNEKANEIRQLLDGSIAQLSDEEWKLLTDSRTNNKDRAELILKLFQAVGITLEDLQNDK